MTTSRPRTLLGVALGIALAATAAWLAIQLLQGDLPSPATQPPRPAPTTTAPTVTTSAPAFTKEGAITALRVFVRRRLESFNTLDETTLRSIYSDNCRLANGRSCLEGDLATLNDMKRKNRRLRGYPARILEVRILSWEPASRTAILRLVYEALPAKIVDMDGRVVETIPGSKRIVDQVNLVWTGARWQQAWAGSIEDHEAN